MSFCNPKHIYTLGLCQATLLVHTNITWALLHCVAHAGGGGAVSCSVSGGLGHCHDWPNHFSVHSNIITVQYRLSLRLCLPHNVLHIHQHNNRDTWISPSSPSQCSERETAEQSAAWNLIYAWTKEVSNVATWCILPKVQAFIELDVCRTWS